MSNGRTQGDSTFGVAGMFTGGLPRSSSAIIIPGYCDFRSASLSMVSAALGRIVCLIRQQGRSVLLDIDSVLFQE